MPSNRKPLRNKVDPISKGSPTDQRSIGKLFQRPPRVAKHAPMIPNAPRTNKNQATLSGAVGISGRYMSPPAIRPSSPSAKEASPMAKFRAIARISNNLRKSCIIATNQSSSLSIQVSHLILPI